MIKIDKKELEMVGTSSEIEAETMSIVVAWILRLDECYGVSYVLDYIKEIAQLSKNIVQYIEQGESVDNACIKATVDMLKESIND